MCVLLSLIASTSADGESNPEQELRFGGQSKDNRHFIKAEGDCISLLWEIFFSRSHCIFSFMVFIILRNSMIILAFFFFFFSGPNRVGVLDSPNTSRPWHQMCSRLGFL